MSHFIYDKFQFILIQCFSTKVINIHILLLLFSRAYKSRARVQKKEFNHRYANLIVYKIYVDGILKKKTKVAFANAFTNMNKYIYFICAAEFSKFSPCVVGVVVTRCKVVRMLRNLNVISARGVHTWKTFYSVSFQCAHFECAVRLNAYYYPHK